MMPHEPRRPEFREPVPVLDFVDDCGTGFELPPDPSALAEVERGPFRPDWERARELEGDPGGAIDHVCR